eukprot:TRINITY_DN4629_c0_g2_i1.p1 TRINITY_DN4629_c0_g2~~TRINITY_DN4629_c0_g2_i1.p1  ORF type:complete len:528 (-),score=131.53 TRINITY_DN4629_c0_g2_i1:24-1607(-)
MEKIVAILCLLLLIVSVQAHICIYNPHQRGPMNITDGGDGTCFRHGAPCGRQAAGPTVATYTTSSQIQVSWQQNYNHYTVGYPGFMDMSWAPGPNPADSDFHILGAIPDYNSHWQGSQRNFSLDIVTPSQVCDPCVFRVRYQSHKPGEDIFYQCADIRIVAKDDDTATSPSSEPVLVFPAGDNSHSAEGASTAAAAADDTTTESALLYGVQYDELSGWTEFVSVNPSSGSIAPLFRFPYVIHQATPSATVPQADQPFILDQICGVDADARLLYFMASSNGLGSVPDTLITVNVSKSSYTARALNVNQSMPINALNFNPTTGQLLVVAMEPTDKPGVYVTRIQTLDLDTLSITTMLTTAPDDTFINFQWAELDVDNQLYYVLFQDENDAPDMDSILYTFDVRHNTIVHRTAVAFNQFTFESIQVGADNQLYSLTPGLVLGAHAWSLITVDTGTGACKSVYQVAPGNVFLNYYGGMIYNGLDRTSNVLYYQLRTAQLQTALIVRVNTVNGEVKMSSKTQLLQIHNIVRV